MKPRTVMVTLEMETDASIKALRCRNLWRVGLAIAETGYGFNVKQVQVNVVKPTKGKRCRSRTSTGS